MTLFLEYLQTLPKVLLFCAAIFLLLRLGILIDKRSRKKKRW